MDATAWVAIAGIAGTLIAPVVGELARRKSTRKQQLNDRRLEAYADLLSVGVWFVDYTRNVASMPGADLPKPDANELNRLDGQIRLVAGKSVRNHSKTFTEQLAKFSAAQFKAEFYRKAISNSSDSVADDAQAIEQRMELGRMADEISTHVPRT